MKKKDELEIGTTGCLAKAEHISFTTSKSIKSMSAGDIKVKLLKYFEMPVPQKQWEVSKTMPDHGIWETVAVNESEGKDRKAYQLKCLLPYHPDRKHGEKMWVYQWVITHVMVEMEIRRKPTQGDETEPLKGYVGRVITQQDKFDK